MANITDKNPIELDTVGVISKFTGKIVVVESVQWNLPTTADHRAWLVDDNNAVIFDMNCVTAKLDLIKYYRNRSYVGLNLKVLGSGKLLISLADECAARIL